MKDKKLKIIALSILLVTLIGAATYAYFELESEATNKTETKVQTSTFDIETSLTNLDGINAKDIPLINEEEIDTKAVTLDFDVKSLARTKLPGKFNIYLKDVEITNNFISEYFKWQLVMDGNVIGSGDFSNINTKGVQDPNKTNTSSKSYFSNYYIKQGINFNGFNKSNLSLKVYLLNAEVNQNSLLNGNLKAKVAVEAFEKNPICIRAKTLHTEECQSVDEYGCRAAGFDRGATITYGNLGTKGTMPVAGDAFDCDVNGDGIYNSTNERFYFVSNYYDTKANTFNNNYRVLIYSNNYTSSSYSSGNTNANGPILVKDILPKTNEWITTLISNSRNIYNIDHNVIVKENFDYGQAAARLLTITEIKNSCNNNCPIFTVNGALYSYNYYLENTRYSSNNSTATYWLENSYSTSSAAELYSVVARTSNSNVGNVESIRPVIEMPYSDIDY